MNYHNTQSQDTSRHSNSRAGPSRRPATISELAERANIPWDESKAFKYHLKSAEKYRREGKEYARAGDMENAFVELAKAATLVLERLPEHPDYTARLNANQRHNLGLVCLISYKNISKKDHFNLYANWLVFVPKNLIHFFLSTEWPRNPGQSCRAQTWHRRSLRKMVPGPS